VSCSPASFLLEDKLVPADCGQQCAAELCLLAARHQRAELLDTFVVWEWVLLVEMLDAFGDAFVVSIETCK
jgi:hypothetical protein